MDHNNFLGPCDVPRVSQYRLAAHLSSAVVLYSVLFWNAKSVLRPSITWSQGLTSFHYNGIKCSVQATPGMAAFRKLVIGSKALAFITLVSGAFVAGLDAGLAPAELPPPCGASAAQRPSLGGGRGPAAAAPTTHSVSSRSSATGGADQPTKAVAAAKMGAVVAMLAVLSESNRLI